MLTSQLRTVGMTARRHMDAEGLTDWSVAWTNSRRVAGQCQYRSKTIALSRHIHALWTPEQSLKTILHEIAHALAPGDGHGALWARECRRLGIKPERCWGREDEAHPAMKYLGTCPNGHNAHMMRLPVSRRSCSKCSRGFNERFIITWVLDPTFNRFARPAEPVTSLRDAAQDKAPSSPTFVHPLPTDLRKTPPPPPGVTHTGSGKAPRCGAPMPGGKICKRVANHTRGHDAR
jgi:hypothetical protein